MMRSVLSASPPQSAISASQAALCLTIDLLVLLTAVYPPLDRYLHMGKSMHVTRYCHIIVVPSNINMNGYERIPTDPQQLVEAAVAVSGLRER
jgi:hypothetical protein